MFSRIAAILLCLATATHPCLVVAAAAGHTDEHRQATVAGHGYSHHDGHIPHRDHDNGGEPIPVSSQKSFWAARPGVSAGCQVPSVLPVAYFVPSAETQLHIALLTARDFADRRSRAATAPSPGNNLPLLI